jgi:hypothetical protein
VRTAQAIFGAQARTLALLTDDESELVFPTLSGTVRVSAVNNAPRRATPTIRGRALGCSARPTDPHGFDCSPSALVEFGVPGIDVRDAGADAAP